MRVVGMLPITVGSGLLLVEYPHLSVGWIIPMSNNSKALEQMPFPQRLETFLSEAWSWGDGRLAKRLLELDPSLPEANVYAACAALDPVALETHFAAHLAAQPKLAKKKGGAKKWPPILYAAWSSFLPQRQEDGVQVLQLLLERGADPKSSWKNKQYRCKESALYGCVDANCAAAARVLLEAGADPNDGESLYHACEKENLLMLETLGDYDLNERDISYCIKHAMDYRWHAGIMWFLSQGADPNAVHPAARETSLHWAIKRNCSRETIHELLVRGADPNCRTKRGKSAYLGIKGYTCVDFAQRLGRQDVVELLRSHGGKSSDHSLVDEFVIACASADRGRAEEILRQDSGVRDRVDPDDQRLVTHVAQMKNWEGVKLMVEHGWSPEAEGGWMEASPLSWAICFGEPLMVDFLLQHGASPTKDVGGFCRTPLHTSMYCHWGDGDHVGALRRLLQEGIDIPTDSYPCGNEAIDSVLAEYLERDASS